MFNMAPKCVDFTKAALCFSLSMVITFFWSSCLDDYQVKEDQVAIEENLESYIWVGVSYIILKHVKAWLKPNLQKIRKTVITLPGFVLIFAELAT